MFKLLIECTKDIDEIHINFSDNTSFVKTKEPKEPKEVKQRKRSEQLLDTEEYTNNNIQDAIIEKPVIEDKERPVKVADELQNLDI